MTSVVRWLLGNSCVRTSCVIETSPFGEWFYKHLDLIKTTLKREWMEGSIQGFMQKADAEKMLLHCASGTFLIQFSEGEPGGISVAWVTEGDMVSGERQVLSLAPWNKHDLSMRSFADRLHDLSHLLILYPNEPKDKTFSKYYTPMPTGADQSGYIQGHLAVQMPNHRPTSNPGSPAPSIVSIGTPISSPLWPPMSNEGLGELNLTGLDFSSEPNSSGITPNFFDNPSDLITDPPSNSMAQ